MQGRYFNISGSKWLVKRNFKTLKKNITKLIFVPLLSLIRSQGSTEVRLFMIKPKHHRRFARFGGGSPFKLAEPNSLTLLQRPSSKKGGN